MIRALRFTLVALLLAFGVGALHAQVRVDIALKRSLYIMYEPIICNVTITNRTGNTLSLQDTPRDKWFGFQIESVDGRPIPPSNTDYQNEPVQIAPGSSLVRSINLTPLYGLNEFGTYRVRATVFVPELNRYFSSDPLNIEITEGRTLWQQTVGVPPGAGEGNSRTITILAHRLPRTSMLYIRIEDQEAGVIYCTTQLGRFIAFANPDIQLDSANQIHILQNTAPKAFLYSMLDLNGHVIKQQAYQMNDVRPALVHNADNTIGVAGGIPYDPNATPPEKTIPKLSERPVPLPTPQINVEPEDKRPENLLSK